MKTIEPDSLLSEVQPKIDRGDFKFMRKHLPENEAYDTYDLFIQGLKMTLADIPLEYGTIEKYGTMDQCDYFVPLDAPRLSKKNKKALQKLSDAIQAVLKNDDEQAFAHLNREFFQPEYHELLQAHINSCDSEIQQRAFEMGKKLDTNEAIFPILKKLQAASDMKKEVAPTGRSPKFANHWYILLTLLYSQHTRKLPTGSIAADAPFSRLCLLIFPKFKGNYHRRFMKNIMARLPRMTELKMVNSDHIL